MITQKTRRTRQLLTGIGLSGMDRLYQQLRSERGLIAMFHHVTAAPVPAFAPNALLTITPQFLDATISLLKARGFDIVDLDEAVARIAAPKATNRFAVLTFDDAYRDNLIEAKPVLNSHGVPYTIYAAPNLLDGSACTWWEVVEELVRQRDSIMLGHDGGSEHLDCSNGAAKSKSFDRLVHWLTNDVPEAEQQQRVRELCWLYKLDAGALTREQVMTADELHVIAADPDCTIGAHTMNHAAVARLGADAALTEMVGSATVLEAELGERPRHFAYPYGYPAAAGARDFELAKEAGFTTAVTTRPGMVFAEHRDHPTALPRISINGLFQKRRYIAPLTTGLPTRLNRLGRKLNVG